MRVLVVSQYFSPEPGATQNRLAAFVDGLRERGHQLTVICEQPCHPEGRFQPGFGRRPVMTERRNGVRVHRLLVVTSPRKTTVRRLAFYGSFAAAAAVAVGLQPSHDVALLSSPPLPCVLSAAAIARTRRIPLVVDVRDPWPAAAVALGEMREGRLLRAFERTERWLYRSAAGVIATTVPFCRHVDRVAGRPISVHVPNGALDELVGRPYRPPPGRRPFVVGYAGNLGLAQGLDGVLDAASILGDADVRIILMGDGPLRDYVQRVKEARQLDRLELLPAVPTAAVGDFLESCDALLVPLGRHPAFRDFIPSKLYDAMAVGRPVIVAAQGEAAQLTQSAGVGVAVAPEDGHAIAEGILQLAADRSGAAALGAAGLRAAVGHARSNQLDRLEAVLTTAANPASS